MSQGSQRIGSTSTVVGALGQLPAGSKAGSGSSRGVWPPPPRRAPGPGGCSGALRSHSHGRAASPRAGTPAALRAKPVRAAFRPDGLRGNAALGRGGRRRGAWKRITTPRSSRLCSKGSLGDGRTTSCRQERTRASSERLKSRRRCQASRGSVWAERLHEQPPLLRRRLSRRTRVGRALRVPPTLVGSSARSG
jgi:hypothetical protein